MRLQIVFRYLGVILLLNSVFLLISAIISFFNHDSGFFPLIYSATIATLFGVFPLLFVPPSSDIKHNEGLAIVVSGWLISCVIGMVPYVLWGGEFSITNAWFESVSGYTTTGSSILTDIESLPMGILFWRASTHWIGGIGIIIFVLAVLPSMGVVGMVLYRTEMSSAAVRQFSGRTKEAVRIILYIYLGLTVLETISLMFCGLNLFDAVTHSFSTIATGGFSTKNASLASFNNLAAEIVIMIFMILSGINFALLFAFVVGNFSTVKTSKIVKYYLIINLIAILIVAFDIFGKNYTDFGSSFRYAAFQVLSVGTSSGFANADSSIWPAASQLILIFFTFQCACAGSTSGGIKVDRILILFKSISRRIKQIIFPNAVISISVDHNKLSNNLIQSSILYIALYIFVVFISTLLLTLLDVDLLTSFSGAAASMGNVGPGLGNVGSLDNYGHLPALGKWIYSFTMLLGRLEIYGLVVFFIPKIWK